MTHDDVPKPCLSRSWTDRLSCTLPQGHPGPHANRITTTHRQVEWFDNPSTQTDARVSRHTVDSITSDALDQLYDRLARAEAELCRYTEAESADAAAGSYAHRAEHAEAAIERVRDLAEDIRRGAAWAANHDNIADRIHAAIDGPGA